MTGCVLIKNTSLYIQVTQRTPRRINSKRFTPRHLILKLLKDKENLKSSREKQVGMYMRSSIRLASAFSSETTVVKEIRKFERINKTRNWVFEKQPQKSEGSDVFKD